MGELAAGGHTPAKWDSDQVCQAFALERMTQDSPISLSRDGWNTQPWQGQEEVPVLTSASCPCR